MDSPDDPDVWDVLAAVSGQIDAAPPPAAGGRGEMALAALAAVVETASRPTAP